MLGGDSKRVMMKANSTILALSSTNKAALSPKRHCNFPKHWLTDKQRNVCSSERPQERREAEKNLAAG